MSTSKILRLFSTFAVVWIALIVSGCEDNPSDDFTSKLAPIKSTASTYSNLYSVVVSKQGTTIMDEYFNGRTAADLNDVKSVGKGITSIVVGKAMELGHFNLETKLGDYLPAKYLNGLSDVKKNITVRQLLTMSSGLGGLETEFSQWIRTPDEIIAVLELDMQFTPGTAFAYSTPNLQMISVIFQEATGKTMHEFAVEHIFAPMQITEVDWPSFDTGYSGPIILLKTQDMLKLGQMVLQKGIYDGKRIMNTNYLEEMTAQYFTVPTNGANSPKITSNAFGYLWWEVKRNGVVGFMTAGYAGQFIAVFPSLDLVIAINSNPRVNLATAVIQNQNTTSLIADIVDALK
jgi:CubicO group peptidase (beta-lactamase class C family)